MIARKMRTKDLAELIRSEIEGGMLAPGTPILSAREMARKYKTSVLTAHRAVKSLEESGLVDRVRGSGTFVAQGASKVKSLRIGVAFESRQKEDVGANIAFNLFPNTVVGCLRRLGHEAVYFTYHDLLDSAYMADFTERMDGFVATSSFIDPATIANLGPLGGRIVVIQQVLPLHYRFHQVVPNLYTGFCEALSRAGASPGSKVFVASIRHWHEGRGDVFREAAASFGIPSGAIEDVVENPLRGDNGWLCGARMGEIFSGMENPFIVSVSDFLSFGIVETMVRNGKRPGVDFTLISFDDLEGDGYTPLGEPVLSSVTFPKRRIAESSVDLLLDVMANPPGHTVIRRIETEFVPRKTTQGVGI